MKDLFKEAIQTYDKIAKIYSEYYHDKIQQYQLTKFISMLPGKKILDVGSGSGRDVEYFLNEGYKPIGIDSSEEMIKESKKRIKKKLVFKKMDFRKLKFNKESFDGVWSMFSLIHTPRDEITGVLKGFSKVLVKKGVLFLAVKEGEGKKKVKTPNFGGNSRTFVCFTEKEMITYLEDAGFEIITSEVNGINEDKWLEIFSRKL